jgi:hypothetical protein
MIPGLYGSPTTDCLQHVGIPLVLNRASSLFHNGDRRDLVSGKIHCMAGSLFNFLTAFSSEYSSLRPRITNCPD